MQFSNILIKSESQHVVMGEVYVPLAGDTDNDAMLPDDVQSACWDFLAKGRVLKIDTGHDLIENGCEVVENFMARKGDPDFKEKSWVMAVRIKDPNIWNQVEKGELNGFSLYAENFKVVTVSGVPVTQIMKLEGTTEPCEDHDHELVMCFDDNAHVIPTFTGETNSHRHKVSKTTATDLEAGHAHRLIY